MNKIKYLLTSLVIIPLLSGCGQNATKYITFHQAGKQDVVVEFDNSTTLSEMQSYEPDIDLREGYYGSWENYTLEGQNSSFTVNAVYTPITYYVDFKAQGILVDSVPFTIQDISGSNSKLPLERTPALPVEAWTTPYWEDYSLSLNNIVVNAKYDVLRDFTVTFMANGAQVGNKITINKAYLDGEGKIKNELIPDAVKNYTCEHHDVVWDFTIASATDTTIIAELPLHAFYVKFVDFAGNQIGKLVPYYYNSTWLTINKPQAPFVTGYTTSWNEPTLSFSDDEVSICTPKKVANQYKVTFEGSQDEEMVTFDSEYALTNKAAATKKWADEKGNIVHNEGVWTVASDTKLHLVSVTKEDFSSPVVPSFINLSKSVNIKSVEVAKEEGINKSNAIKFVVNAKNNFGLCVEKTYLDEVFADSSIKSLTMVLKSDIHNNNFRHRTNASNVCYELNNVNYGLETVYKKFSFTKDMYLNHQSEGDFIIYGGAPDNGTCANEIIYIDSFIFDEEDVISSCENTFSFENGYNAKKNTSYYYYCSAISGNSETNYSLRVDDPNNFISKSGFDYEYVTDGIRSGTFSKENGYVALFLPVYFNDAFRASESQQFTFDIYIHLYDQPLINSTSTVKNMVDGHNNPFNLQHKKDMWVTYTMDISRVGTDGRFLIFQGSTAGDYYLDNFRIVNN